MTHYGQSCYKCILNQGHPKNANIANSTAPEVNDASNVSNSTVIQIETRPTSHDQIHNHLELNKVFGITDFYFVQRYLGIGPQNQLSNETIASAINSYHFDDAFFFESNGSVAVLVWVVPEIDNVRLHIERFTLVEFGKASFSNTTASRNKRINKE